ncbi:hypothetical protein [Alicyclobacillus macrosporangiidus]|uniref:Uncharacterized protein n=1 Tax=Alicyclobacillus macrosporangiidus TaxID=392015 RepID=A0A1I7L1W1_9BACL|nr:hypothetical protein [Alicyclobacillus macrosporangiidus]SFV03625.1 hypothetical protein SAMN05421543_12310 [Alicyclobacillus macrosporangiidus]
MPKRNLHLTDQASVMLDQFKQSHPDRTLGDIVSEAIVNYVLMENRNHAEQVIENIIERRLMRMESGLRTLISSVAIDVCMILYDVLEQREAERISESPGTEVDPKQIYAELREEGVALFNRKRAFQVGAMMKHG